jgi:integrase/recombinase XerD
VVRDDQPDAREGQAGRLGVTERLDINTVRAWLGHVSIDTTNIYAEIDLETKANALAKLTIPSDRKASRRWGKDPALMAFLRSL